MTSDGRAPVAIGHDHVIAVETRRGWAGAGGLQARRASGEGEGEAGGQAAPSEARARPFMVPGQRRRGVSNQGNILQIAFMGGDIDQLQPGAGERRQNALHWNLAWPVGDAQAMATTTRAASATSAAGKGHSDRSWRTVATTSFWSRRAKIVALGSAAISSWLMMAIQSHNCSASSR